MAITDYQVCLHRFSAVKIPRLYLQVLLKALLQKGSTGKGPLV